MSVLVRRDTEDGVENGADAGGDGDVHFPSAQGRAAANAITDTTGHDEDDDGDDDGEEDNDDGYNDDSDADPDSDLADTAEALRGALARIAHAAERLDTLPHGCTFTVAIELQDDALVPDAVCVTSS